MQAQAYVEDEHSLQLLLRWTSAFSRSLMWHVREECDLEAEMQVPLLLLLVQATVLSILVFSHKSSIWQEIAMPLAPSPHAVL